MNKAASGNRLGAPSSEVTEKKLKSSQKIYGFIGRQTRLETML